MDWSVKPQPVIGELLPGFTAISILVAAYLLHNSASLTESEHLASSAPILAGSLAFLLLASWALGTLFDAIRDLLEWPLDKYWFQINWNFLSEGTEVQVQNVDSHWLAYYFLTGNFSIALLVCLILSVVNRSLVPLSAEGTIIIIIALGIFIANTAFLRLELKTLMGDGNASELSKRKPHEGMYARLGISTVAGAGVGVFAVSDIPIGTDVFGADDAETVMVEKTETLGLRPEIRKLYHDFCVLKNGTYECPVSFNSLTVSWYLNTSETPNVRPDSDLRFKAIREIKAGEELLANYEEYSENEDVEFVS
jgi:hypothetical protein